MIKNENMNKESIQSLKDFKLKQIKLNKKYYLTFIIFISLINIGLIIFIILFKSRINKINNRFQNNYSYIKDNKNSINNNQISINKKVVNIIATSSYYGVPHLSYIFEKSEEVQMVKNHLFDFYKEVEGKSLDVNKINFIFVHQGIINGDTFQSLTDNVAIENNILMVIETKNKNKFGFYSDDYILFENGYISLDKKCFIFSFQNKKRYNCNGTGEAFKVNKDYFFNIGNGDIIINNNFFENGGIIKSPLNSFDNGNINSSIFTESLEFKIKDVEIYSINLIGVFQLNKNI